MQNACKYKLCPWVLQSRQSVGICVISMTSMLITQIPTAVPLKAGYGEIMREGVAVPPVEDLVAQMQADWAASRDPFKEGPQFCFVFWGFFLIIQWQILIMCSMTKNNSRNKRPGSNGMKGKEWWGFMQCPEMNDAICMFFFSSLLIMAGTLFFPLITVGDYTTIFSKAVFIKEHV